MTHRLFCNPGEEAEYDAAVARARAEHDALLVADLKAERARVKRFEEALREARDLLLERNRGSAARSPAHNARLVIDAALAAAEAASPVLLEGDLGGVSSASAPASSHGCICPPGAELSCQGVLCPRRGIGHATAALTGGQS